MKMRRCEDEKVRYRPPLLEEPCAQTLSGKKGREATHVSNYFQTSGILVQHFTLSLKHHFGLTR